MIPTPQLAIHRFVWTSPIPVFKHLWGLPEARDILVFLLSVTSDCHVNFDVPFITYLQSLSLFDCWVCPSSHMKSYHICLPICSPLDLIHLVPPWIRVVMASLHSHMEIPSPQGMLLPMLLPHLSWEISSLGWGKGPSEWDEADTADWGTQDSIKSSFSLLAYRMNTGCTNYNQTFSYCFSWRRPFALVSGNEKM